jgi:hypothetical protein
MREEVCGSLCHTDWIDLWHMKILLLCSGTGALVSADFTLLDGPMKSIQDSPGVLRSLPLSFLEHGSCTTTTGASVGSEQGSAANAPTPLVHGPMSV